MGNGRTSHFHSGGQIGGQTDDVLKLASHIYVLGRTRRGQDHVDGVRIDLEVVSASRKPAQNDFIGADLPCEL
jgi:hypothetical protein